MMREAAEIGLVGFTAPEEVGGGGNSWFTWDHVLEQIGYICNDSGLPILLSYRESAANLVYRFRSPGPDRTLCAPCCERRVLYRMGIERGSRPFQLQYYRSQGQRRV
ncbi:MAG TPA: hypothetical protein EYM52_02805 [Dehalococcoidia bacterium]|nr:hypothetical protein [Dehalococcoidia bacterium]